MNAKEKRRSRDAKRNVERLHFKFIAKYIEGLHGDAFIEAQELYEHAKRKNPKVKDLTKTAEFMSVVTPNKPIPRHYKRRQVCDATPQILNDMSRMVLNIPLVQLQPDASLPPAVTSPPSPPAVTSPPLPTVVASPPSPPTVASPPSPPMVTSPPLPTVVASPPSPPTVTSPPLPAVAASPPFPPTVTSPAASPPLPPLPSDVYQSLLEELKQDPDLWRILNDFPVLGYEDMDTSVADEDTGMDTFVAQDMGDAFISDDLTPLEIELEGYY